MNTHFTVDPRKFYYFLDAAQGNYRNSIYLKCHPCPFKTDNCAMDFLFIPNCDCMPILLPIKEAEAFFGHFVNADECLGILTANDFMCIYHKYLSLSASGNTCLLHSL